MFANSVAALYNGFAGQHPVSLQSLFSSCIFSFPGTILDRLHMSDASSKPQLLIVDDEAEVRGVLRDLLGDTYDCGEATSAEEALTQLRARDYHLVLSDMPINGLSSLKMIPP